MKKFLFFLISSLALTNTYAQNVAINADASLPNSSAMLDVKSTSKGMLIPRVALISTFDVTTIPSPATSLMVYNTTAAGSGTAAVVPGFYFWDGSWVRMVAQKGGAVNYQDFYAMMPSDNSGTIPSFGAISFPRTTISNSIITQNSPFAFNLPDIATYEINFQVSVTEATQLEIILNNANLPFNATVVGRFTGNSQIVGVFLVTTTSINTSLSIINSGYSSITLTPWAGNTAGPISAVSAHLIIKKLN